MRIDARRTPAPPRGRGSARCRSRRARSTRVKCRRRSSSPFSALKRSTRAARRAERARRARAWWSRQFVTATRRPPGRSTRASSRERRVEVGHVVEHPGRERAVERRRRRTAAPGRRRRPRRRRARASARPSAPTGRPRRPRAPSSCAIRSASSPRPQPTSSTRAGRGLGDRVERSVAADPGPSASRWTPRRGPRAATRPRTRRGRARGSSSVHGVDERLARDAALPAPCRRATR